MFFSFLQDKMCAPEKSGASQRFWVPEPARSTQGIQFVQACEAVTWMYSAKSLFCKIQLSLYFTGKYLRQCSISLKKFHERTTSQMFSCEFFEIYRKLYFVKTRYGGICYEYTRRRPKTCSHFLISNPMFEFSVEFSLEFLILP